MDNVKLAVQKLGRWFSEFALVVLFASTLWGQAAGAAASQDQTSAGEGTRATQATQATPEKTISPEAAKELFRSVDEILQFASQDTGLPIKHEVKRQLASREQVVAYLEKNMDEDKEAKRLQRS